MVTITVAAIANTSLMGTTTVGVIADINPMVSTTVKGSARGSRKSRNDPKKLYVDISQMVSTTAVPIVDISQMVSFTAVPIVDTNLMVSFTA